MTERELLGQTGAVKLTETSNGMEIKWELFSANWASLFYLIETVHLYSGPFTLKYFVSGWFKETVNTPEEAKNRLQSLLAKSDIHIAQHTFVKDGEVFGERMPHILRDTLSDMAAIPEFSVDCVLDDDSGSFLVQRVGSQSGIAKLFGVSPVSVPCLTGNSYDEVVSEAYQKVVSEDKPHYDHVIAAMNLPDQSVSWVPYQRVILPHRFPNGDKGVAVVSELIDVDIKIV